MAAAFDGQTKVGRAVADPRTDRMLPNPGLLMFPAIATPVALSGTIGADCKLVHGDRWQKIDGSFTEIVDADLKTTITGNQTHAVTGNQTVTVTQNHNETIVGNCLQTVIGPQIMTNMNVRNETRMVTHAHTHGDFQFVYDPSGQFHYGEHNFGAWLLLIEFEYNHIEAAINHLEGKGSHFYFALVDTSTCLQRLANRAMNEDVAISWGTIRLLQQHIRALEVKCGLMAPKAVACAPIAGVDPNPTPLI
jgi:hypothetical protein